MGYARIVSGGTDGRYTIELDYGSAQKTGILAAMSTLLAQLDTAISQQEVQIVEAVVLESAQLARVQAAQAELIAATGAGLPAGSPRPDTSNFKFELAKLSALQKRHAPLRLKLETLKFDKAQSLRRVAYWNSFDPLEQRQAWCADFTEDAPVGAYVATLDIPGESAVINLAPGCRAWQASDGILTAREIMSPSQAFFNVSILPGWQKFLPTYRWATVTAIDYASNTMDVALFSATSSAQSLPINQSSALSGVDVEYMDVGAPIFEVGDRVVVQFIGQSWGSPKVIGFLDNPRPPGSWKVRFALRQSSALTIGLNESLAGAFSAAIALALADNLTVDYRVNRGGWIALTRTVISFGSVPVYSDGPAGLGRDVLVLSSSFVDGQEVAFTLWDVLVSTGQFLEVRARNPANDLILNIAAEHTLVNAGPINIALVGPIAPIITSLTTARASYALFQSTGD